MQSLQQIPCGYCVDKLFIYQWFQPEKADKKAYLHTV
jgi:hypothetical protein